MKKHNSLILLINQVSYKIIYSIILLRYFNKYKVELPTTMLLVKVTVTAATSN